MHHTTHNAMRKKALFKKRFDEISCVFVGKECKQHLKKQLRFLNLNNPKTWYTKLCAASS